MFDIKMNYMSIVKEIFLIVTQISDRPNTN